MSKELSANTFNGYSNNNIKPNIKEPAEPQKVRYVENTEELPAEKPHHFFDFLNTEPKNEDDLIEAVGGLLPEAQGEDYEQNDFTNRMKKKRKRKRGQQ
ncbi:hypothetical protein [Flavobacterium sp. FlaQc-30]|uniref:hypothetical protein n=1 Tax=Flavobacterium sp. FlaQc-30 TaxID=3374179 RepID=UPI003757A149